LNLLGLLDSPTEGEVILEGKVVSTLRERELATVRNRKLGFVFQSFHLIPDLRVIDNVELPMLYGEIGSKERRSRALAALETVGLKARTHHFPTQLSGGQQQRVAIARAIVGDPTLLLADEPTGNLDSHMSDEIMNLLRQLNSERGATIVMVTHDASRGAQTHRIIRMCDGQLVDEGKKRCLKAI
jgi:putative ABC transport system ATP-binding protein